jgi:hypothetical protein
MFSLTVSLIIARTEQYFSWESRIALSTASFLNFGPKMLDQRFQTKLQGPAFKEGLANRY